MATSFMATFLDLIHDLVHIIEPSNLIDVVVFQWMDYLPYIL